MHTALHLARADVVCLVVDDLVALRCFEEEVDEALEDHVATCGSNWHFSPEATARDRLANWLAVARTLGQPRDLVGSLRNTLRGRLRARQILDPILRRKVDCL